MVDIQNDNHAVGKGIRLMCDRAESIFASNIPSKRQRNCLLKTVESLIELQNSVVMEIPDLIPDECTQCALRRIHTVNNHKMKTQFEHKYTSF